MMAVTRRKAGHEEATFQVTFLVRGPHSLTNESMTAVMRAAVASEKEGVWSSSSSINGATVGEVEEEEGDGVSELGLDEENEG